MQLQDETTNISVLGFGALYIKELMVHVIEGDDYGVEPNHA